jgi:hypothetical protein
VTAADPLDPVAYGDIYVRFDLPVPNPIAFVEIFSFVTNVAILDDNAEPIVENKKPYHSDMPPLLDTNPDDIKLITSLNTELTAVAAAEPVALNAIPYPIKLTVLDNDNPEELKEIFCFITALLLIGVIVPEAKKETDSLNTEFEDVGTIVPDE